MGIVKDVIVVLIPLCGGQLRRCLAIPYGGEFKASYGGLQHSQSNNRTPSVCCDANQPSDDQNADTRFRLLLKISSLFVIGHGKRWLLASIFSIYVLF
ncbi:hypothetical protein BD410DRAFT_645290 [Rickenella mellea]|uniref:Uncharacterized protein n=1 Tax=Rickenella mellea TaxID=50990 RepID=A0A4Y7PKZ9_9AGAM|nr:hypothetical protein BD410DRAFT_645290 [Rickenella mellea]